MKKPESKYAGLPDMRKTAAPAPAAEDRNRGGRPKGTSADSAPVTLHLSADTVRRGRMRRLELSENRPFSKVVELLLEEWIAGRAELPKDV